MVSEEWLECTVLGWVESNQTKICLFDIFITRIWHH